MEASGFGVEGAFRVQGVLSVQQCAELILITEKMGYNNETHPNYQNPKIDRLEQKNREGSDRCVWEEEGKWTEEIWKGLNSYLPSKIHEERWVLCEGSSAINNMFRFYKYGPGGKFGIHQDNAFYRDCGERSCMSILIYLTDDFEGGCTTFLKWDQAANKFQEINVKPEVGAAVVFFHSGPLSPWHCGQKHTSEGKFKYVLRSDVMFSNCSSQ